MPAVIRKNRKGYPILVHRYYLDACAYCAGAELEMSMPTLFDAIELERAA